MHIACVALCPSAIINIWLGSISENLVQVGYSRSETWAQPPREGKKSFVSAGREEHAGSCIHPVGEECWNGESLETCWRLYKPMFLWSKALPVREGLLLLAQVCASSPGPALALCPSHVWYAGELDTEIGNSSVQVPVSGRSDKLWPAKSRLVIHLPYWSWDIDHLPFPISTVFQLPSSWVMA